MSSVKTMQDLYAAFGRGDILVVLGGMDSEIEWREAENNPYQPSGAFLKLGGEWDGFTVTPHEFHDAGDTVIVETRYTGTYKATGKSLDAQATHVWRLRDGKVVSFQQYVDTAQLQDVMGARS